MKSDELNYETSEAPMKSSYKDTQVPQTDVDSYMLASLSLTP